MKFYKETEDLNPNYKFELIQCNLKDNLYLIVRKKFTEHSSYPSFYIKEKLDPNRDKPIAPTDELIKDVENILNRVKEDIKDFDVYLDYLKNKRTSIQSLVEPRVYDFLLQESDDILSYRLRRNTIDNEIDICYLHNKEEFELARNYFFPKTIEIFEPKKGDIVKYSGEIYSIEKIDKKVILQNIKESWFSDKVIELKLKDLSDLIEKGIFQKYNSSVNYNRTENVDALLIHDKGSENDYNLYVNILTSDEIDYLSNNEDVVEDDEAYKIYQKLDEHIIYNSNRNKDARNFIEINNINVIEELTIYNY